MKRIGVFLAEGMEEIEALTVVDILRRADLEAVTISITDQLKVTGSHKITVLADQIFDEVSFETLDGLVLPGGMPGAKHLKEHGGVLEQIKAFSKQNKLVAAICAAPGILGFAGLLNGKKAVCYPGYEDELTGAVIGTDKVVKDGNIITSRGMGTAVPFALALAAYFEGEEKAESIKESILYGHAID